MSTELEILKRVVLVLSSKCQLHVVSLTSLTNYTPTLIDNHCCANWGLDNISQLDLYTYPENPNKILIDTTATLTQNTNSIPPVWEELQKFAFISHHVVQHWYQKSDWIYRDFHDFVAWPDSLQKSKQLEKSMYRAIYMSQQYSHCEQQIQSLSLS